MELGISATYLNLSKALLVINSANFSAVCTTPSEEAVGGNLQWI